MGTSLFIYSTDLFLWFYQNLRKFTKILVNLPELTDFTYIYFNLICPSVSIKRHELNDDLTADDDDNENLKIADEDVNTDSTSITFREKRNDPYSSDLDDEFDSENDPNIDVRSHRSQTQQDDKDIIFSEHEDHIVDKTQIMKLKKIFKDFKSFKIFSQNFNDKLPKKASKPSSWAFSVAIKNKKHN
ncbi:hypothetical protein BpHYR1_014242 [Brachionus plicatilis]|uniref:Uncharacterized protein n=1 Tax=Brachionus plicatilis TaxID=10195 RepID=A0A3M7SBZ0_BRAPC|nr:hypothetical protein BpHYR1_014242 [Brachionus plicatilis]